MQTFYQVFDMLFFIQIFTETQAYRKAQFKLSLFFVTSYSYSIYLIQTNLVVLLIALLLSIVFHFFSEQIKLTDVCDVYCVGLLCDIKIPEAGNPLPLHLVHYIQYNTHNLQAFTHNFHENLRISIVRLTYSVISCEIFHTTPMNWQ